MIRGTIFRLLLSILCVIHYQYKPNVSPLKYTQLRTAWLLMKYSHVNFEHCIYHCAGIFEYSTNEGVISSSGIDVTAFLFGKCHFNIITFVIVSL
jgi:hypothetical protein